MRNGTVKKIKQSVKRTVMKERKAAINDWCNFVNNCPLKRRLKLAFLVIKGEISFEKLDTI